MKFILIAISLTITSIAISNEIQRIPIACAGAGGVKLTSGNESYHHLYSEEVKNMTCPEDTVTGEEIAIQFSNDVIPVEDYEAQIKTLVDIIDREQKCLDLKGPYQKYLINLKKGDEQNKRNYQKLQARKPKNIGQAGPFIWSEASVMCSAAMTSTRITNLWKLYLDIKNATKIGEIITITKNEDTAESCRNVEISGTEDLAKFYVKTNDSLDGKITVIYNTFNVPDRVMVSVNNGFPSIDSTCIGTEEEVEQQVSVPTTGIDAKATFNVKANCDGTTGTAWTISVSCKAKPIDLYEKYSASCLSKIGQLEQIIKNAMENLTKVLDRYWLEAICHKDKYSDFQDLYKEGLTVYGNSYLNLKRTPYGLDGVNAGTLQSQEQNVTGIGTFSKNDHDILKVNKTKQAQQSLPLKSISSLTASTATTPTATTPFGDTIPSNNAHKINPENTNGNIADNDENKKGLKETEDKDSKNIVSNESDNNETPQKNLEREEFKDLYDQMNKSGKWKPEDFCMGAEEASKDIFLKLSRIYCTFGYDHLFSETKANPN